MSEKKVSARELRRVLGAAAPTIQQLAHNDKVTQQRIIALEKDVLEVQINGLFKVNFQTFWQRLRWIFRGEQ